MKHYLMYLRDDVSQNTPNYDVVKIYKKYWMAKLRSVESACLFEIWLKFVRLQPASDQRGRYGLDACVYISIELKVYKFQPLEL